MDTAMLGVSGSRMHSRPFFAALAFATVAPLVALPLYAMTPTPGPGVLTAIVVVLWTLTGNGHVLSTLWFAADPDYAPVVSAHRWRMVASLAIVPVTVGLIAVANVRAYAWLYAAFLVWQAHHYNRQNYGILSLAAANDSLGPLPRDVSLIINATTVAGALGMVTQPTIYPRGLPLLPFQATALVQDGRWIAAACFIAAGGITIRLLWKNERLRRSPRVVVFLGLSNVFFLPSLLPGAPQAAFWPYAMAHGAQYLVIMGVTSRRAPHAWTRIGGVAVLALALGAAAFRLPRLLLAQGYMGVVVWHFLADARLWRLRDPVVRAIVRRRFSFLFPPKSVSLVDRSPNNVEAAGPGSPNAWTAGS
jgi:hypothetical protein